MLFINECIAHLRGNTSKHPHVQTSSTKVIMHAFSQSDITPKIIIELTIMLTYDDACSIVTTEPHH